MSGFRYEKDHDNIALITLEAPQARIEAVFAALDEIIRRLEQDAVAGAILLSGTESLSATLRAEDLAASPALDRREAYEKLTRFKSRLRRLETLGKPVVAAIDGPALGAEFEILLAAHRRIVTTRPEIRVGLPQISSGTFPGLGGLVRLVYLLGPEKALPLLQEGSLLSAERALELGLVDELARDRNDLLGKAKAWIEANPAPQQPWDRKGFQVPGGGPAHPRIAPMVIAAPAALKKKFPQGNQAQETILAAAVESAQVDIEPALRIESRYLVELLFS